MVSLNLAANGEQPKDRNALKKAPATPMGKMATSTAPRAPAMIQPETPPAPDPQQMMAQQQQMYMYQQQMYQQQMYQQQMQYYQQHRPN